MKVSGVIDHVLDPGVVHILLGYLLKPMIFDPIKGESAVTGKLDKSPDRIAFSNPQFKPDLALVNTIVSGFPDKRSPATKALKTLFG